MLSPRVSQMAFFVGFLCCAGVGATPLDSIFRDSWTIQMRQSGNGPIDVESERSHFDETGVAKTKKESGILELNDAGRLVFKSRQDIEKEANQENYKKEGGFQHSLVQNIDDKLLEISKIISEGASGNGRGNYREVKKKLREIKRLSKILFCKDKKFPLEEKGFHNNEKNFFHEKNIFNRDEKSARRGRKKPRHENSWLENFYRRWEKIFEGRRDTGFEETPFFRRGHDF
jgi:hypothetical protein